jgi:hypothetical protein
MRRRPPFPRLSRFLLLLVATTVSALAGARVALAGARAEDSSADPATLWNLMAGAQFVVLADVEAVTDCALWKGLIPPPVCRGETDHLVAELQIREIWKLHEAWIESTAKFVEVSFVEGVASPEPPRYEQGDLVVAFLRHAGPVCMSREWETVRIWPGALFPAASEVDGYRSVLVEALRIQSEWPLPRPAPSDWLALAASRQGGADQGARRSD